MTTLCPTIHQTMLKTKKQSSISVMRRSAKCIGLTEINEQSLKGNIQKYLDTLEQSNLDTKKPHQLAHWLIIALYCDEDFGAKRPVDICNLQRSNIQGDCIVFTAQKNNFKYESEPLSDHILEPLRAILSSRPQRSLPPSASQRGSRPPPRT
eukprot:m.134300 g.134300  ORF g.134300 m.134300 type:complete len:152 (-) comp22528_c0_seq9:2073-2528(-)